MTGTHLWHRSVGSREHADKQTSSRVTVIGGAIMARYGLSDSCHQSKAKSLSPYMAKMLLQGHSVTQSVGDGTCRNWDVQALSGTIDPYIYNSYDGLWWYLNHGVNYLHTASNGSFNLPAAKPWEMFHLYPSQHYEDSQVPLVFFWTDSWNSKYRLNSSLGLPKSSSAAFYRAMVHVEG